VILPDHPWKQLWNLFWLALCLMETGSILLYLSWGAFESVTQWALGLYITATVFFGLDMVLQSCTAFRNEAGIICDDSLKEVRLHYVSGFFLLDLICTLPFALFLYPLGPYAFHIATLVRLVRPFRALQLLQWSNSLHRMPRHLYLIRTLFLMLMLIHVLTCLSIILYRWREPLAINPISQTDDLLANYEQAFYWMVALLSTVGLTDIHPHSVVTRLFTVIVMCFSVYLNLYMLSAGLAPALKTEVLQEKLDTKRSKLAAVLKFYNVPWSLQKQVFTIYPHVLEASMHDMQEVSELPNYLQDQLYTHIKKNLLNSVPLLQDAGPQCVATIASHMPRVFAPPFKYLIKEGEVGECMFFLVRGIVEVLVKDDNGVDQLHCTLKEGSWFGEIALLKDIVRTASVRSVTVCWLFQLDKRVFNKVLQRYPEFGRSIEASTEARLQQLPVKRITSPITFTWRSWARQSLRALNLVSDKEINPFVPQSGAMPSPERLSNWRKAYGIVALNQATRMFGRARTSLPAAHGDHREYQRQPSRASSAATRYSHSTRFSHSTKASRHMGLTPVDSVHTIRSEASLRSIGSIRSLASGVSKYSRMSVELESTPSPRARKRPGGWTH